MSIEKDLFLIDIGTTVIDLAEISPEEWNHIGELARDLIHTKQITEVSRAYIGAFIMWLDIQSAFRRSFNDQHDVMN